MERDRLPASSGYGYGGSSCNSTRAQAYTSATDANRDWLYDHATDRMFNPSSGCVLCLVGPSRTPPSSPLPPRVCRCSLCSPCEIKSQQLLGIGLTWRSELGTLEHCACYLGKMTLESL